MLRFILLVSLIGLAFASGNIQAQETSTENQTIFRVQVVVDSAWVRAKPLADAQTVGSIFEGLILEAVGRNADGTWFEARKPGHTTSAGWIATWLVSGSFNIEFLPLTDTASGVTGSEPITETNLAVFVWTESVLRAGPQGSAPRIGIVPFGVTVPVIARNQDATRLRINYLGTTGWIAGINVRDSFDLMTIPLAPDLPPLTTIQVEVIPPEVQRAQAERLQQYITTYQPLAESLALFWFAVQEGEIMPCNPPPDIAAYIYSREDIRQLPELRRIVPQVERAANYLEGALDPLKACGAVDAAVVTDARNAAINASGNLRAAASAVENLIENVIR